MDGWQAAQNWIAFITLAGGVGLYYRLTRKPTPSRSRPAVQTPASTTTAVSKQPSAKPRPKKQKPSEDKSALGVPSADRVKDAPIPQRIQTGEETPKSSKSADSDKDFVKLMLQARQGVDVKAADKHKGDRPRTVKPKGSTPVLASAPFQVDGDDSEWSPVVKPQPRATGVEDMLEAPASGPSSLRITAPLQPPKTGGVRQPKKEVAAETKKQRQNRQRVEQQKQLREEEEKQRKALEEKQRRTAREARGEPARNGIPIAAAPAVSPWSAQSSAAAAAPPPTTSAAPSNGPLLDTFDAESTSSSNDAQVSTAATSTTDGVPGQWGDDALDERISEALAESSPWEEAPTKRKGKAAKTKTTAGSAGGPLIVNGSNATSSTYAKANGFAALNDEAD